MRQPIFRGTTIELDLETVCLPNGREAPLEIVRHPGGAAVLAVDELERVCLLRQFRHAAGGYIWELPAGKIDAGEPPLATAQRELAEEAVARGHAGVVRASVRGGSRGAPCAGAGRRRARFPSTPR